MGAATPAARKPRRGSKFFRYLARRLLQAGISVLAVIVLGFVLLHLAPGDPVDVLAGEFGAASPEYLAAASAANTGSTDPSRSSC